MNNVLDVNISVISEYSPNMIFINEGGKIVYANKMCEEIMGYSRTELYSDDFDFKKLIAPKSQEIVKKAFMRHMKGEEVEPYEYELLTKGGKKLNAIITTKLIDYNDSKAILGIVTDITHLKKIETALKASETMMRSMLIAMEDMVFVFDKDGRFIFHNAPMGESSLYKKPEEFLNKKYSDMLPENISNKIKKAFNVNKKNDNAEFEYDLEIGKAKKYFSAKMSPIFIDAEYRGSVAVIRDITTQVTEFEKIRDGLLKDKYDLSETVNAKTRELKWALKELQDAKRISDIGRLAGTIAHELRNPLGVISTALYNIKRKNKDSNLDAHINSIEKKIAESNGIIQNVLTFSGINMPQMEEVRLYAVLEEVIESCSIDQLKCCSNIIKKYNLKKDDVIEADRLQLTALFRNIIYNACESMKGKDGKLKISVDYNLSENSVEMVFEDSGIGIDEKDLEKIFDPFFTLKCSGVGLGLTVCNQVINLHGGKIDITSEVNEGTKVRIMLPIKKPKQ